MGGGEEQTSKQKPLKETEFERMQMDRASMMFDPILDQLGYGFNGNRLQYYGQQDPFAARGTSPASGIYDPINGGKPAGQSITDVSPITQGSGLGLGGQQPFMDDQSRLAAMATGGGGGLGLSGADAYWQSRPDVQADPYYGSSPQAAYEHFQQFGQGEGSQWTGGAPQQQMQQQQMGGGGDPTMSLLAMQYKAAETKYNEGEGSARDRNAYIAARDQMREFGVDPTQPGALDKFLQGTSFANPQERGTGAPPLGTAGKGGQAGGDMGMAINNSPGGRQFQPSYAESLNSALEQNAGNTLLQGSGGNFAGAAPDQQTGDLYTQSGNVLQQILAGNASTGDASMDALLRESIAQLRQGQQGGGSVSPELKGLIDQTYNFEQQRALQDLQRFGVESAGSRGLNISDTPISQPLMRAGGDVISSMASNRAGRTLDERNVGLNRALQQTGMGLQQQNQFGNMAFGTRQQTTGAIESNLARSQALREFSEGLRQRQIDNLMRAQQLQSQFGLGLYAPRFGASSSSQTGGGGSGAGMGQFGSFLGGAGGLAGGLSMLGGTGAAAGGAAAGGAGLMAGGAAGAGGLATAGVGALAMF
jgi:hypothetical protein